MDGKTLSKQLNDILNEDFDTGIFYDKRTGYEYLNQAATELTNITRSLTGDVTMTTVADQITYSLPADFVELSLRDGNDNFFAKYSDGTTTTRIILAREEEIVAADNTTSIDRPSRFFIEDFDLATSQLTGTTTSAGAASAGKSNLIDTGKTFITSGVSAGDTVHNTTDGSTGRVLSVTSETVLVTALFDGTDDDYTSGDAYVIVMQPRLRIVLDPPPSDAGDTITINGYIKSPAPVYSDYDTFGIKAQFTSALVRYAGWMYKYQDRTPDEGDKWFVQWDRQMRQFKDKSDASKAKKGYRVVTRVFNPNR